MGTLTRKLTHLGGQSADGWTRGYHSSLSPPWRGTNTCFKNCLTKVVHGVSPSRIFLPSACEGWGRYCFHRCLSVHNWVPQSQVLSQVIGPRSFPGGYPSPRFFPRSLVPGPFQGIPSPGWGVPQSCQGVTQRWGTLSRSGWGTPPAIIGLGYPADQVRMGILLARSGLGTTQPGQDGVHPGQDRAGVPALARSGWGTPPSQVRMRHPSGRLNA